jgi:hypothetical protein
VNAAKCILVLVRGTAIIKHVETRKTTGQIFQYFQQISFPKCLKNMDGYEQIYSRALDLTGMNVKCVETFIPTLDATPPACADLSFIAKSLFCCTVIRQF